MKIASPLSAVFSTSKSPGLGYWWAWKIGFARMEKIFSQWWWWKTRRFPLWQDASCTQQAFGLMALCMLKTSGQYKQCTDRKAFLLCITMPSMTTLFFYKTLNPILFETILFLRHKNGLFLHTQQQFRWYFEMSAKRTSPQRAAQCFSANSRRPAVIINKVPAALFWHFLNSWAWRNSHKSAQFFKKKAAVG